MTKLLVPSVTSVIWIASFPSRDISEGNKGCARVGLMKRIAGSGYLVRA